jgi:ABC-type branched-subunit amino acid transport system substrate-binding protein
MAKAGFKVSYVDLSAPIDGNMAPDVQKIQRAGSNFIVSCMDLDGNISLAREVQQYGVHADQLWFNGYDQSAIDKYSSLMQHVSFFLPSVPLNVPLKDYLGLAVYLKAMRKYEPQYADAALAPEGWISAALFVAGVRAAGSDLTQQRVIKLTNEMTSFNGGGLTAPGNWTDGHEAHPHIPPNYPVCSATVRVKGTTLEPVYLKGKGSQVFLCLGAGAVKNPVPVTPPSGTPGA